LYRSRILGSGRFLPPRVVTNQDLGKLMDTSDEWIQQRTGIRERRYVDEGVGSSDLGLQASVKAIAAANLTPQDINFIIFATLSPDYGFPGSGCLLQDKLGVGTIGALDVRNQCSGFIYGLTVADQFVKTGSYERVLVVGAEVHSTGLELNTHGRDVAVLFGDGAGAVVVGRAGEGEGSILSTHLHSEGKYAKKLWIEVPGCIYHPRISEKMLQEGRQYPIMEGRYVFKHAVDRFQDVVGEALGANQLTINDVDLLILHQANMRIAEAVTQVLKISPDRVFNNIEKYGNTTAASIPIALDEALEQSRIKPGDLVVLAAFGSGFTWAAAVIRW
jgi:3-oxoacyl-[acyl-carrier-protein] synthase-3